MVTIDVDEAYAFDFLSIAFVKKIKKIPGSYEQYAFYENCIKSQIGDVLFNKIIESPEYDSLIKHNNIIYEKLEEIRVDKSEVSAKIIDNLNTSRYISKINLQNKFFTENVREIKSNSYHATIKRK